jgi:hypothetical protein
MRSTGTITRISVATLALVAISGFAMADSVDDEQKDREMAEIQRQLNIEVMVQPFGVEEMAKIDSYIAEAMKRNLVPQPYKGAEPWRQGMTCSHLSVFTWRRNCQYYHRYYGHYYP